MHARLQAGVGELLKLPRQPGQAVLVPDDDGVDLARLDVGQHALVVGAALAGPRRQVVVHVGVMDLPAQPSASA